MMRKGIAGVIGIVIGVLVGTSVVSTVTKRQIAKKIEKIDKFKNYYNVLNQWLALKQEGKSLEQYFVDNHYKTIGIYGMGEMGTRFYEELKRSDNVRINYGIDKNAMDTFAEIEILEPEEELPQVDIIVVTAIFAFDEIEKELRRKVNCQVVSLDDIIYEI